MVAREQIYTAEEFWEIAENTDRRLELADGNIIEMSPSSPLNTVIAGRITTFLNNYVIEKNAGYVTVPDGGFKLTGGSIRQPDAAFISKERLPSLPDHFEIAPDLAVEVVSPNEDVLKKVNEYLKSDTRLVWVIYPQERMVHVFRRSEPRWETLETTDTLDGEDVLPGFKLAVKDIFPD